jgi:hypothetical protein
LGDEFALEQFIRAARIDLREFEGRIGIGQFTFRRIHVRLIRTGVELRDDLAGFDRRIEIGE